MSAVVSQPLYAGQRLKREEFLRRWEAMPELKNAELIGGLVYMPSRVGIAHSDHDSLLHTLLGMYAFRTPGCRAGSSGTWLMQEDAPQPDAHLIILPDYGGQSCVEGSYHSGAPELAAEISVSTASYDMGPKLELYRNAGVREYLAIILGEPQVLWQRLVDGHYTPIAPDADGLLRSHIFPGLWLDAAALLALEGARVLDALEQGFKSPEHAAFVARLAAGS